jgi:glycosyltransferase involved in cell wall biosynthesis/2-polyprenyl-3-methyl-5-hydroxy-6-metoxy-1,4-benzoquinol methylase
VTFAFLVDSVPFTAEVILQKTSLGGSESACVGLARALKARGHDVSIFTTQLAESCAGKADEAGVRWHPMNQFRAMNQFVEFDVVVALRMFWVFTQAPINARLRILWSQDLLVPGQMQNGVMAIAWALDKIAYVSEYHRKQWEHLQPELKGLGWATRNGFDPADLPEASVKDPHRIIHISRPERGLGPLLQMWPALKQQQPKATLHVCRYSSMYDQGPGSWSDVCAKWDAQLQAVNDAVGGIVYLGELTKKQLYKAIAEAAVMWYPGVSTFAETNCIAALEAQACGTPFVGSYRGALPETCPSGILIRGDAEKDESYHAASVQAVSDLIDGCATQSFRYRRLQKEGQAFAEHWTYARLAESWASQIEFWFQERYERHAPAVLRQLLHEDDHTAAKRVALEIGDQQAAEFCQYVIDGKDQTAEQYGNAALADPLQEAEHSDRFKAVVPHFKDCAHVLDVACGNGSFAIALATAYPSILIHGLDYSASNIERATDGAQRAGVADRCTFEQVTVYDFDRHALHQDFADWLDKRRLGGWAKHGFTGLFVGEFIEHVANYQAVIDGLEAILSDGAQVVYTCPHGACAELVPRTMPLRRGHVHRFHHDDVIAVWGQKRAFGADYLDAGVTERGNPLGNWLIHYQVEAGRLAGQRPYQHRIRTTRPFQRLSVGILAKDAENDLARCLSSIYSVADEIIIGDTGSTDTTVAIAEAYGPKVRVVKLPSVEAHREGFAGARNAVLRECTGDWFLWIDTDETLLQPFFLRRYLDGSVYHGYVIPQTHLYIDAAPTFDIPVRLFRNTGRVQFYGCIHEQPQDGDANGDIQPSLHVGDLTIAHTGYLTQDGREQKRVNRNLPLLIRDQQVFPERELGQVLVLREAVIQADTSRAAHGGQLTDKAASGYAHAIRIFIDHFDDPAHKYHKIARPWYEAALQHLGVGWEQEIALGGRKGGLEGRRVGVERIWVRDADEFQRIVDFMAKGLVEKMRPITFLTDPDVFAESSTEAVAV